MRIASEWVLTGGLAAMALSVVTACHQGSTGTSDSELSSSAAELADGQMDGMPDLGPRPRHALNLDCTRPKGPPAGREPPDHRRHDGPPDASHDHRHGPGGDGPRHHGERDDDMDSPDHVRSSTGAANADQCSHDDDDRPPRGDHGPGGRHGIEWVYDANGDHALDDTERAAREADRLASCENRRARILATYDQDGDGTLSPSELEAAQAAIDAEMEARRTAALATYDTNGDGRLDCSERQALVDAKHAAIRERFDANGDGEIIGDERAALAEAIRAEIRSGNPLELAPPH